jgi:polysaccharide pyruvyl transferase WcaK-like protein
MKKKINAIIIGWHNHLNIGDEANLFLITKIINSIFDIKNIYALISENNIRFNVQNLKPLLVKSNFVNKIINYFFLKHYIRASSVIIFGAGGIFRSCESIKKKLNYLKYSKLETNILALGVSIEVEEFKKNTNLEKLTLELFRKFNLTIVRDKKSYIFLKRNKLKNLYHLDDLSFLLPNFIKNKQKKRKIKTISISLRDWHDNKKNTDLLIEKISNLTLLLIKKYDFKRINLLPFCRDVKFNDIEYLEKFYSGIKLIETESENKIKICKIYEKKLNYIRFFNLIQNSDLVIGMRLHSQIFSLINDVPLIFFSYSEKVCNYFNLVYSKKVYSLNNNLNFNLNKINFFLNKNLFKEKKISKMKMLTIKKIIFDNLNLNK